MPKHYGICNICDASCGLEIEYEGREIISIKGDKLDPFSQGHMCPKGRAHQDIYNDPDRLRRPVRRTGKDWEEISWQQAMDETGRRRGIQKRYNLQHQITPETIKKDIAAVFDSIHESDYVTVDTVSEKDAAYESSENIEAAVAELEKKMMAAAKELAFERAAVLRDQIADLKKILLFPI